MDIYQKITDSIVAQLEKGVRPWAQSWTSTAMQMPVRVTGQRYSGINVLTLWFTAVERGYSGSTWMTYKQAAGLGGQVRKGEKGTMIVFTSTFEKQDDDGNAKRIPFLKAYTVFNVEQIDDLPAKFYPAAVALVPSAAARIEAAEKFFGAIGATVQHGGGRAFYSPPLDIIQMPVFEAFSFAEGYYATLAHEHIHWSGAEQRLDRLKKDAVFGSQNYAEEELVAEIGAAFVMAILGLHNEPREDHASYIASWLKDLKNDKRLIVKAASAAEKATKFLAEKAGMEDSAGVPGAAEQEQAA